jgi:hypothetical protein
MTRRPQSRWYIVSSRLSLVSRVGSNSWLIKLRLSWLSSWFVRPANESGPDPRHLTPIIDMCISHFIFSHTTCHVSRPFHPCCITYLMWEYEVCQKMWIDATLTFPSCCICWATRYSLDYRRGRPQRISTVSFCFCFCGCALGGAKHSILSLEGPTY